MNIDSSQSVRQFSTTRWSVVLMAGDQVSPEGAAALETLCQAYWLPVCLFARRKGWTEADAKDLTQQFFARLLQRNDFTGLDPRKGKFRTFLLSAFTHFLANEYDRTQALKRGGGKSIVSLEQFTPEELFGALPAGESQPQTIYDVRWAQAILQSALQRLKEEMRASNKQMQFDQLKRFLTPGSIMADYAMVAKTLGIEVASVPVAVHRMRQRYRELVRAEVAQTVSSPVELEEEMRYLFLVLNQ